MSKASRAQTRAVKISKQANAHCHCSFPPTRKANGVGNFSSSTASRTNDDAVGVLTPAHLGKCVQIPVNLQLGRGSVGLGYLYASYGRRRNFTSSGTCDIDRHMPAHADSSQRTARAARESLRPCEKAILSFLMVRSSKQSWSPVLHTGCLKHWVWWREYRLTCDVLRMSAL